MLLKKQQGQAIVEIALILPILFLLIFSGIDIIRARSEQARFNNFNSDLTGEIRIDCPDDAREVYSQDSSTHTWNDSLVKTMAEKYSIPQSSFAYINGANWDEIEEVDVTNPFATQFMYMKDTTENTAHFQFKLKHSSITGSLITAAFESEFDWNSSTTNTVPNTDGFEGVWCVND